VARHGAVRRAGLTCLPAGGRRGNFCIAYENQAVGSRHLAWLRFPFTFFGPLLPYEFVRNTRRYHFALYCYYAYLNLGFLVYCFLNWFELQDQISESPASELRLMGEFAHSFLVFQFLFAGLLTPAAIAGIIADEKQRGTLASLLSTGLRSREIVLGKLVPRTAYLLLLVLAGVPIACAWYAAARLHPAVALAALAATAMTVVGLAGVSVLCSVYARKPRDAIFFAYMIIILYLVTSYFCSDYFGLFDLIMGRGGWGAGPTGLGADAVRWFSAGDPIVQLVVSLLEAAGSKQLLPTTLGVRLLRYAVFHGVIAFVTITWAIMRLRAVYSRQAFRPARAKQRYARFRLSKRGPGDQPLLWKELFMEGGLGLGRLGKLGVGLFFAGSFLVSIWVAMEKSPSNLFRASEALYVWSRVMGALVGCILLAAVGLRASTAISGERERNTLDGLLITPLDRKAILVPKWLGSIACVRWGWVWLALIWGCGIAFGGLNWLAVPLLVLAWAVYAGVIAMLGLWFSVACRNSLRATIFTLLVGALVVGVLTALPGLLQIYDLAYIPQPSFSRTRVITIWLARLQVAMSPFMNLLRMLTFPTREPGFFEPKAMWELPAGLASLLVWLFAGAVLWWLTLSRFRAVTACVRPASTGGHAIVLAESIKQKEGCGF
jgi:ABC-type transport system involved in multi-copper enzyme maturation permease subunit